MRCIITIALVACCMQLLAQDSAINGAIQLPDKYLSIVDKKIEGLNEQLTQQTDKYLNSLNKQEEKIRKSILKLDSSRAAKVFGDSKARYSQLSQKLNAATGKFDKLTSGQYIGGLDSLQGSLAFLKDAKNVLSKSKDIQQKLSNSLNQVNQLQNRLKEADDIQVYLQQRQEQIKQLLARYTDLPKSVSKYFGKYQQQAFYYGQQLKDLKSTLNDPDKLMKQMLATLQTIPSFQKFMGKYSILASMFPVPDNFDTPQALAGLQTRINVQQALQQQMPANAAGRSPRQLFQQQMQAAQGELNKMKDKLSQLRSGNNGSTDDLKMPDFKPNEQKTLPFKKRIIWGVNFQTQKSNNYYPVTTDFAVTSGYKLNDKSIIGISVSGKMGWGQNWKHIRISAQGVSTRFFVEWKAPDLFGSNSKLMGSLWLTGGAEMHYNRTIESLAVFKNYSNWSKSALVGVVKKYSMSSPFKKGKKMQGSMSVLYDVLYKQHIPPTPALLWRVGYAL